MDIHSPQGNNNRMWPFKKRKQGGGTDSELCKFCGEEKLALNKLSGDPYCHKCSHSARWNNGTPARCHCQQEGRPFKPHEPKEKVTICITSS